MVKSSFYHHCIPLSIELKSALRLRTGLFPEQIYVAIVGWNLGAGGLYLRD